MVNTMKPTHYLWMDGRILAWKNAKVHVLSHTLHHGCGAFEGIRVYATPKGPALFRLQDHLKRLQTSFGYFYERLSYSQKELENATVNLIKKNNLDKGYVRIIVFFGMKEMGVSATQLPIHTVIAVYPWNYLKKTEVCVKTVNIRRLHPKTAHLDAKIIGHYFNSALAGREAKWAGYDEALQLDYKGYVAEGPAENIFMVKKGTLYTPTTHSILPGITRDTIIKIAQDLGIKVVEKNLKLKDFYTADEAFFTGTAIEIVPIVELDNHVIGTGKSPVTKHLKKIYQSLVHGKVQKYLHWQTFIKL